jgi:hypothetical protein
MDRRVRCPKGCLRKTDKKSAAKGAALFIDKKTGILSG